jgi:cation-transporting ATPase F
MFRIGLFTNRPAIWGALGMIVLQVLFAQTPWMNRLFHTAPIGLDAWVAVTLFGLAVYVIIEIEKRLVGHALQGDSFRPPPRRG